MTRRVALLLVVFFWVALASFAARAGTAGFVGPAATTAWSPVAGSEFQRLLGQPLTSVSSRAWAAGTGGGVTAAEVAEVAAARGAMTVSSAISVTAAEAAAVVGRCLLQPVCVAATAAAAIAYDHYRAKPSDSVTSPTSPSPSDVVQWDPGLPPADVSCNGFTMGWTATDPVTGLKQSTCSASTWCDGRAANVGASYHLLEGNGSSGYTCTSRTAAPPSGMTISYDNMGTGNLTTEKRCVPDTITIGGTSMANTPGFDGKCRSGVYSQARTIAQIAAMVALNPPTNPGGATTPAWKDGVQGSVEQGKQTAPATITTTGPATQTGTGTSSTTTGPSGTTTTTTTPTTTYHYDGDTITYNNTFVTVTNTGGDTTTTEGDGDPTKPEDPCAANPQRIGCAKIGTPEDTKPTWTEKPVTYAPEDLGVGGGSCPAPVTWGHVNGHTFTQDLGPLCNFAPGMRLVLILLTTLSCAYLIVSQTTRS